MPAAVGVFGAPLELMQIESRAFSPLTRSSDRERGELAHALERAETRFRELVQRAGYGIYRSSPDGRFLDVNPALVRMLGYDTAEELKSIDLATKLYPEPGERERLRLRLLGVAAADWVETCWQRRDGVPIRVRVSVTAVCDELGRVECYEGIAEDITERRRRDELLRRSERMASLGATLAGVAHELNNPLAAIMGFAQILLKRSTCEDERAALETISHEAARSAKIVRDLLTLSRKREAERHTLVNLNDALRYIVRTRRYALETHGITCELHLAADLRPVLGDRTQLEQVLLNLVNNAEQAIRSGSDRSGGRIAMRTCQDGDAVTIAIEDDGPGIPAESLSRIWDPFWTTKGVGHGTGLGLAVVHGIVAEHGGTIEAERLAAHGARFVMRLPLPTPQLLTAHGCARISNAERVLDVLVVDPEPEGLSFLSHFLESRGHAMLAAEDGERAMRLAEQMAFDAVICDASFVGGARDVLCALRSSPNNAAARFIISAAGPETTSHLPMPLPFGVSVVMRPYDVEELRLLLEEP
jgi:two-component system cell cycle sensor histidine kinase/response regulator CckA